MMVFVVLPCVSCGWFVWVFIFVFLWSLFYSLFINGGCLGCMCTAAGAIIKGSALVTLWAVVSAMSYSLILIVPVYGPIIYFFLTFFYTLGMINSIGHPSGDD